MSVQNSSGARSRPRSQAAPSSDAWIARHDCSIAGCAASRASASDGDIVAQPVHDQLGQLLELLGRTTAVDFQHYKRGTVLRRVTRRLAATSSETPDDHLALVRRSPAELEQLRKDLLISVTRFFRDGEVFTALQEHVLRELVQAAPAGEPLRVWVPGCATGEEAYTLAMLLSDASPEALLARLAGAERPAPDHRVDPGRI